MTPAGNGSLAAVLNAYNTAWSTALSSSGYSMNQSASDIASVLVSESPIVMSAEAGSLTARCLRICPAG